MYDLDVKLNADQITALVSAAVAFLGAVGALAAALAAYYHAKTARLEAGKASESARQADASSSGMTLRAHQDRRDDNDRLPTSG